MAKIHFTQMEHFVFIVRKLRKSDQMVLTSLKHWQPVICGVHHCMWIVYGWHVLSEQHHFLWQWQFTAFIAQISRNNAMNLQIIETNKNHRQRFTRCRRVSLLCLWLLCIYTSQLCWGFTDSSTKKEQTVSQAAAQTWATPRENLLFNQIRRRKKLALLSESIHLGNRTIIAQRIGVNTPQTHWGWIAI